MVDKEETRKVCHKVIHRSKQKAMVAIKKYHRLRKCRPYFCDDCNGWHIGRPRKRNHKKKECDREYN